MKPGPHTKLTPELIEVLKKVIDEYIYCTDEELVFLLNEQLPTEKQISYETFSSYKLGRRQQDNELIEIFVRYIKKALIKEKNELLERVKKGENNWQSKAWILERKFTEWNLKAVSEIDLHTDDKIVLEVNKKDAELLKDITDENNESI